MLSKGEARLDSLSTARLVHRFRLSLILLAPPPSSRLAVSSLIACDMAPNTAYTLLPTTPTRAEGASTAYLEKQEVLIRHARDGSLSAMPASFQQAPAPWRRLASLAVLAALGLGTIGAVMNHRSVRRLVGPEGELQYTARHKIAYNFETAEIPSEWSCNPFQEPGRMFVDTENKVRFSFFSFLAVFPVRRAHSGLMCRPTTSGSRTRTSASRRL